MESPPSPAAVHARHSAIALRCNNLVKRYGDVRAVDGIDLEVYPGECFGLLGPNGAGKTTTLEILEGLTVADAGSVEVLGCRWGEGGDRELRQRLGVQLQETQLAEKLTVAETVRLFRSFYARGSPVDEVIRLTGLQEKRRARVGKLSGGQKQRLALACALLCSPELLFLDEPTTGLDPQARLALWEIVEDFKQSNGTVLMTTHYMDEAARLCDRVAIIDHGQIIALDAPAGLVASLGAQQIIEFRAEESPKSLQPAESPGREAPAVDDSPSGLTASLRTLPGVAAVGWRNGHHVLTVDRIGETLPALLSDLAQRRIKLTALQTRQATLEDVFVHLTGRALRDGQ
jgi:ABC-2 type transport system ATP-binding protein